MDYVVDPLGVLGQKKGRESLVCVFTLSFLSLQRTQIWKLMKRPFLFGRQFDVFFLFSGIWALWKQSAVVAMFRSFRGYEGTVSAFDLLNSRVE